MPIRKTQFVVGEYYHIYNRGVDKRVIFSKEEDVDRFFQSMDEFNVIEPIGSIYENSFHQLGSRTPKSEKLVNFIAYCLNPNHYHFLLEQVAEKGIEKFMQKLGTGHTNYFNNKYHRNGSLFQGRFKAVHIGTNEQLLHISAYVNLNDRVHQLGSPASKLIKSRSSWEEYMEESTLESGFQIKEIFCNKDIIIEQFKNKNEYKKFAEDSLESILERKENLKETDELLLE